MPFPARLSWLLIEQGQARGEREVNAWSQSRTSCWNFTLSQSWFCSCFYFQYFVRLNFISLPLKLETLQSRLCMRRNESLKEIKWKKKRKNSHVFQIDVNTTNAQLKTWTINYRYCYDCKIYSLLIQTGLLWHINNVLRRHK